MLMPKRVKHRKQMRGRMRGNAKGGSTVAFGEYGLKALDRGWITNRQIEAARVAMTRKIKRGGKVWINIFPDKPFTEEAGRDPDGLGQGQPRGLGRRGQARQGDVRAGRCARGARQEALRLAGHKLPIRTKFVMREGRSSEGSRGARPQGRRAASSRSRGQQEPFNLRFRHATGELENTSRLGAGAARRGQAADGRARSAESTSRKS